MTVAVTPLKNSPRPGVLDEITAENASVHIERMSNDHYWIRINDQTFAMRGISTVKQRPISIDLTQDPA